MHPSLARDRRTTLESYRSAAHWIAYDPVADSRAFEGARWLGDGVLDLCATRLDARSLSALDVAFASGRVRHLFACSNRLGPEGSLALARCESARSAWLGDNQLSLDGALRAFERFPNASALWLGRAAIGPGEHRSLCAAITGSTELRALDLSGCELDAEGCLAVAEAARQRSLAALFLDGNALTSRGARSLASVVSRCDQLVMLRLNATRIDDESVAVLCDALVRARSLRALGLSSNGLTDTGAEAIARLVAEHPALRAIEVGFVPVEHHSGAAPNELTERGLRAIIEAASVHRALRSIEARGATLPERSHAAIIEALAEARCIDGFAHEGLALGPYGDALRATLARNANHQRPASDPFIRELLAPLRRWRSQLRETVVAPALISQTVPALVAPPVSPERVNAAIEALRDARAREAHALTEDEQRLRCEARSWARPIERRAKSHVREARRSEREQAARARDRAKIASTAIRSRASSSGAQKLEAPQKCYACREPFTELDAHYDRLCPRCAALHHQKRAQRADLRGCLAIVTGARVHIGYRTTLSLLRCGCSVIATSRFVNEAWVRFAAERDFDQWRERLEIRPLDLRFTRDVERFADSVVSEHHAVDVLVNNAAQTVARPPSFYAALRSRDEHAAARLPPGITAAPSLVVADTMDSALTTAAPTGSVEDPSSTNSWRHEIDDVSVGELVSAHAVNVLAPYVLVARLRTALVEAAMLRGDAFVLNVTSIEGQFAQRRKPSRHPHTNMAKAALNMLTRTIADSFARERVLVCSVDPGWVSPQNPFAQDAAMRASGFAPPLDAEDGAARVLDPVFRKKNGETVEHGALFKDYVVAPW